MVERSARNDFTTLLEEAAQIQKRLRWEHELALAELRSENRQLRSRILELEDPAPHDGSEAVPSAKSAFPTTTPGKPLETTQELWRPSSGSLPPAAVSSTWPGQVALAIPATVATAYGPGPQPASESEGLGALAPMGRRSHRLAVARPGSLSSEQEAPPRSLAMLAQEAVHGVALLQKGASNDTFDASSEFTSCSPAHAKTEDDGTFTASVSEGNFFSINPQPMFLLKRAMSDITKVSSRQAMWNRGKYSSSESEDDRNCNSKAMARRIYSRLDLGKGQEQYITGDVLHRAMSHLGITVYSEEEMHSLIRKLNAARRRKRVLGRLERLGSFVKRSAEEAKHMILYRGEDGKRRRLEKSLSDLSSLPASPKSARDRGGGPPQLLRADSTVSAISSPSLIPSPTNWLKGGVKEEEDISFDNFMDCILDPQIGALLNRDCRRMLYTIAEMLSSGNINRIVSKLASIELDELAAPPPKPSVLEWMEPVVAFLIVLNGVLLGLQSDAEWEAWRGWWFIEVFFVTFYLSELSFRLWHLGCGKFFYGHDFAWNMLDVVIIALALVECALEETWNGPVLRLLRLTRLSRLLRILRFRCFLDLTLMLKGLLGGFRTLGWAMVLLLSAIYIISLFLSSTIGNSEVIHELFPVDGDAFFGTVPRCMFTAFRCFTGDCSDSAGNSIVPLLHDKFGYRFSIAYTVSSMIVTFGIFNLIVAIYIEATLTAAKQQEASDRSSKKRESLHVAHTTKKLMKRFCTLQRIFKNPAHCLNPDAWGTGVSIDFVNDFDDIEDDTMSMNKDMFLAVMEDRFVQAYMDELDIVSCRAHLFDVFDSDGNGVLQIVEIVQGMLSIRGEPKKSDSVACLLSVRALQNTVQEVAESIFALQKRMGLEMHSDAQGVSLGSTRYFCSASKDALSEQAVTSVADAPTSSCAPEFPPEGAAPANRLRAQLELLTCSKLSL